MLNIVGTIKIGSAERQRMLIWNLESMQPIAHLLRWRLNIVGRCAQQNRTQILKRWPGAAITTDSQASAYQLLRQQLDGLDADSRVFMWLEDHWFLCPHVNLFTILFETFEKSAAELLSVTHLTTSWANKHLLTVVDDAPLYTVYLVNAETQARVWEKYPGAFLTGIPAIYSRQLASDILESRRSKLEITGHPGRFELPPKAARTFLRNRGFGGFLEMVPKFHVFREVFARNEHPRGVSMANAEAWLGLRDGGDLFGGHPGDFRADRKDNIK